MSIWKVLGIEATVDAKVIKRAYVKQLKITKPDEDPQGFMRLREAYDSAVNYARYAEIEADYEDDYDDSSAELDVAVQKQPTFVEQVDRAAEPEQDAVSQPNLDADLELPLDTAPEIVADVDSEPEPVTEPDAQGNQEPELLESNEVDDSEGETFFKLDYQALESLKSELIGRVRNLLVDPEQVNSPVAWDELFDSPVLDDVYCKPDFTREAFEYVSNKLDYNESYFDHQTLLLIESYFLWKQQRDLLELDYSAEDINRYYKMLRPREERMRKRFICPKQHSGVLTYSSRMKRLGAFVIDAVIFVGVSMLVNHLIIKNAAPESWVVQNDILLLLLWFIAFFPAMEASPLQGTIGHILFDQKVVSKNGRRLNIFRSAFRSLMFIFCTAAIKFLFWINFLLPDDRMIHDYASGSLVIDKDTEY